MTPGFLISAPASGTGKTTLTLGLLAALKARGVNVQPFKCGPDYIDPAFHSVASGRASANLDSWAMARAQITAMVSETKADLILAEGAMGLFDGGATTGAWGNGASADIAALMGWPVVLVIDVSGQAQSAGAVARGFQNMRPDVTLAGVVLNRVASPRHEALARQGVEEAGISVFGALPRNKDLALPERHLGLVQAQEQGDLQEKLTALAAFVADHVALDQLMAAAGCTPPEAPTQGMSIPIPAERIALARDDAFSFVYPHLLNGWRKAGATILPFSPLADEAPDPTAGACWLPGGYPELHAGRLAAAETFRTGLSEFARIKPVHGECGGYMALGAGLIDAEGKHHQMAGLLGLVTSFEKRRMHLGYRAAELLSSIPGHPEGAKLRGHEFHYSTIVEQPDAALAQVTNANGDKVPETGSYRTGPEGGYVSGTFFHLIAEAT